MKKKALILFSTLLTLMIASCYHVDSRVVAPSWKGFDYTVKKPNSNGNPGDSIEIKRGEVLPGDPIRVSAVRKNTGVNVGQMHGDIYLRYTIQYENNHEKIDTFEYSSPIVSPVNSTLDGWKDPYATFQLPQADSNYVYYQVEAACQFNFKTFGNADSDIYTADTTSHEDPYLGHIYTDLKYFHPYNGGIARSGKNNMEYHTLYKYTNN